MRLKSVFFTPHSLEYVRPEDEEDGSDRRTELSRQQIKELILAKKFVSLGATEKGKKKWWLIYDHIKKCCVILITKKGNYNNQVAIVSIWEHNFQLPPIISRPDEELCNKAKELATKP